MPTHLRPIPLTPVVTLTNCGCSLRTADEIVFAVPRGKQRTAPYPSACDTVFHVKTCLMGSTAREHSLSLSRSFLSDCLEVPRRKEGNRPRDGAHQLVRRGEGEERRKSGRFRFHVSREARQVQPLKTYTLEFVHHHQSLFCCHNLGKKCELCEVTEHCDAFAVGLSCGFHNSVRMYLAAAAAGTHSLTVLAFNSTTIWHFRSLTNNLHRFSAWTHGD